MSVTLKPYSISAAPLDSVTIVGSNLVGATAALTQQGYTDFTGAPATGITPLTVSTESDGNAITVVIPDGANDGPLVVTGSDSSTFSIDAQIVSQYLRADEYAGEGVDLSTLAPGELDTILRRASAYADAYIGYSLRLQPYTEKAPWTGRTNRVYPRRSPIVALSAFSVQISNVQYASFSPTDVVVDSDQRFMEILSSAVASYTLFGAIQNIGLVANIVRLQYTAGYLATRYPPALKTAISMIATELLDYRAIQKQGLGGISKARFGLQQLERRQQDFAIPLPAKESLRPFMMRRLT